MCASRLPVLVYLWLCLIPALGFPLPKRLSGSEIGEDVLAGSDFLSVFMRTSPSRSVAINPASPKYGGIFGAKTKTPDYPETNSVLQKSGDRFADINLKGENALEAAGRPHDYDHHQAPQEVDAASSFGRGNNRFPHSPATIPGAEPANDTSTTPDLITVQPTMTASTTTDQGEEEEEAASTFYDLDEEEQSELVHGFGEDRSTKPTVTQYWSPDLEPPSLPPPTPDTSNSTDKHLQVISVRVSSSVVRHSQKIEDQPTPKPFESERLGKPASTLVTQEQPTITAIQRSHLNVEEATLPEEQLFASYHQQSGPYDIRGRQRLLPTPPPPQPPPPSPPQPLRAPLIPVAPPYLDNFKYRNLDKTVTSEASSSDLTKVVLGPDNSETKPNQKTRELSMTNYHSSPEALTAEQEEIKIQQTDFYKLKDAQNQTDSGNDKTYDTGVSYDRNTQVGDGGESSRKEKQDFHGENRKPDYSKEPQALAYQYNPQNPQLAPVSYHTSVSSATSGSRVQFYSEPAGYRRGGAAATDAVGPGTMLADSKHREPAERSYEEPERVYATPEQNYEVDEVVSVVTNGRSHGVQVPTAPPPPAQEQPSSGEDNNKFGYVVEGRNFRKYRVEERTADGFIVGEYGVVSHDDGSLRGVRYTADSTINPRLIYDALVKFLSLK